MILNAHSILQHLIQNKNGIIKHVNVDVKIIVSAKKITVRTLAHVFVRKVSIYKSIADTSVTEFDEIIFVVDIVLTKKTNTIATKLRVLLE